MISPTSTSHRTSLRYSKYLYTAGNDLIMLLTTDEKGYLCRRKDFDLYSDLILHRSIAEMKSRDMDAVLARTSFRTEYKAFLPSRPRGRVRGGSFLWCRALFRRDNRVTRARRAGFSRAAIVSIRNRALGRAQFVGDGFAVHLLQAREPPSTMMVAKPQINPKRPCHRQ